MAMSSNQIPPTGTAESEMRDKCEFCLGAKGGVRGNENVFAGIVACDYCTVLVLRIRTDAQMTSTRRLLDEALNSGDGSYRP